MIMAGGEGTAHNWLHHCMDIHKRYSELGSSYLENQYGSVRSVETKHIDVPAPYTMPNVK